MFYHLKSSCRFHIKIVQRIYLSFTSNQVSYCRYFRLLMENASLAMVPVRRFVILLTWFTLAISTRSGTAQFSRGVSPSWTLPSMGSSKYIRILLLVPQIASHAPFKARSVQYFERSDRLHKHSSSPSPASQTFPHSATSRLSVSDT